MENIDKLYSQKEFIEALEKMTRVIAHLVVTENKTDELAAQVKDLANNVEDLNDQLKNMEKDEPMDESRVREIAKEEIESAEYELYDTKVTAST